MFTNNRLLTTKDLNFLYNLSNITANIASNEGFGLGTAEAVMAGTPIVVNVTGGMQDQCGFKDHEGNYLTENDYSDAFQTNAEGTYTSHGEWVKPVFPAVRTLQGSIPTPYIFDDIACYRDTALKFKEWYDTSHEERERVGQLGREHYLKPEVGLSAESMGNNVIEHVNTCLANWKPRKRTEFIKI
jgi:hypothetical protein